MPTLRASLDGLLFFIAIALFSALSNWLKKRQQPPADEADKHPAGHPQAAPATEPPPARSWEEELRRLLEGDLSGHETPPPTQPPPPVIHRETVVVVPTPQPAATPTWSEREKELVPPLVLPRETHFPKGGELTARNQEQGPDFELARMEESASAYQRGQAVQEATAARLQQIAALTASARPEQPRERRTPAAARDLVTRLHHPATARQAVLAAVVLGPPRGLETGADALGHAYQPSH
jgi:hypothetical protein